MNKLHMLLIVLSFLVIGCNQELDEPFDESVLSELPCFEYVGYTYYVHPRLAVYTDWIEYKEIEETVKSLDSYGYNSWFIPSLNELEQAAKKGYLPRMFDGYDEMYYISSSKNGGKYQCLVFLSGSGWNPFDLNNYGGFYTVRPMIKFRKNKLS